MKERRLRRAVRRLDGCLDILSVPQRRVLILRAGVGAPPPFSRAGVARRLDLRLQRVRTLERRGLRRARTQARTGGCAGGAVTLPAGPPTPAALAGGDGSGLVATVGLGLGSGAGPGGGSAAGGTGGGTGGDGAGSGSAPNGSGGGSGDVRGESALRPPSPPLAQVARDITLPLVLLALAGFAVFAARSVRRDLGRS